MSSLDLLDNTPEGLSRYAVLNHLGSGATADVFLVKDKEKGRPYVLKQMPLANMSDEEKLRAKQEILVMNGVDHPNVVKFHESFSSDSSVDIVMEYCEGGTLEDLIEHQRYEGKPFPEEVLIEWMAELLCALSHIHSKRILHRDLKTSNIFVTAKNHLKLGDFGVCAILTNANAKAESMIGTPLYFAPEVCENEAYDERSDVWSLGIVFYEMCTLRRPFEADNLFSLIQKILTAEVAPFNTGLESHFEELVRSMLNKAPKDRPTAQELVDAHLNVPKNHPSHPSQKPSRSRLVQQYYGPELRYEKVWPPPASAKGSEAAQQTVKEPAPAAADKKQTYVHKAGHNDAKDYINDDKGRAKYRQMLIQTLGATAAVPAEPTPAAPEKKKKTVKTKASSSAKAAMTLPPEKTNKASSASASTKLSSSRAVTAPAASSDSLNWSQMDELKLDVARRRTEMFGEQDSSMAEFPVVIAVKDSVFDTTDTSALGYSSTMRATSSFLEDIALVVERHTTKGKKIKLEELDDAAQLLSQYKLTNYGLY